VTTLARRAGALAAVILWCVALGANTPVADAARAGDRAAVRRLLQEGADVNAPQGDGMTALHWAATNGDLELADLLLRDGASHASRTRLGGYTPLSLAAEAGHGPVAAALVKAGADVNAADTSGTTALMLAAASGDVEAIRVLLDGGADVHARERVMEQTALMFAAASNRAAAIGLLLARGARLDATSKVVNLSVLSDPAAAPPGGGGAQPRGGRGAPAGGVPTVAGVDRPYTYNELVGAQGGLTPLLFAIRQGHRQAVTALVEAGAGINQVSAGDHTSPLLMAVINGHFDVAQYLLERGADVTLANDGGVTPLYAAVNIQWGPKSMYPQPQAYLQQTLSYLDLMKVLLAKGADVNARVRKKVWFTSFNTDLSGVDEIGATAFWRAAYASDVAAMRLLVSYGADPNIPTVRPAGRPRPADSQRESGPDVSALPPVPVGGPGVPPLLAAAGVGYGEGYAANSHRYAPTGFLPAIKYLVEELGADVNAVDYDGNTAVHHAAARGDTESILFLVAKGADVTRLNREGQSTADMANAPTQRVQPFPETLATLVKLGAINHHKCVSC
jgi:ankyrin repeat protein